MKKEQAVALSNLFEQCSTSISTSYEIIKLKTVYGKLQNFHQWSNGKPIVAGYKVIKSGEDSHFLLLIDWHRNDNFYLVIYSHNKATTLAEIHQIEENEGIPQLQWKYNPLKRDGLNSQRKAYFLQVFGTTTIHIPLPTTNLEIETFFNQLFKLCTNRVKADNIVNVFPMQQ